MEGSERELNTFYQLMNRAPEKGIIHTVVQTETGNTWWSTTKAPCPFNFNLFN